MTKIRELLPEQKPIERMEQLGASQLSLVELLAILIGSGTREENALDLAQNVLRTLHESSEEWKDDVLSDSNPPPGESEYLDALENSSLHHLMQIRGIGRTKAVRIHAACQLAKKLRQQKKLQPRVSCENPAQIAAHFDSLLDLWEREYFYVLFLNGKLKLIRMKRLSAGGIRDCSISPRELYRQALRENASSMILVHNHPSGDTTPSEQDWKTTEGLVTTGFSIGLPILDHLVLGGGGCYTSMRRERPEAFLPQNGTHY